MKKRLIWAAAAVAFSLPMSAVEVNETNETEAKKEVKLSDIVSKPKFSGYLIGNYNATFQDDNNSNTFSIRLIRLVMTGRILNDFEYKIQGQVNGNSSTFGESPRIVDMSLEWLKHKEFKVKIGQFKRPFTYENPMNPIDIGFNSQAQGILKLAGFNDRTGEQSSSGRDIGIQVSGDLLPNSEGRTLLHYEVGVFNGQGINHTDKDHAKDFIGGLWIRPIKTLEIGGFGWIGQYTNESFTNPEKQLKSTDRKRWGAGLKYEDKWTLRSEYMYSYGGVVTDKTRPFHSDAWYVTLGAPIFKNFKVYGRWDCYRDAHTWASLKTDYGLSANYTLGKNLIFQFNYTFTDDRSARNAAKPLDSHYNTLDVQVTARF